MTATLSGRVALVTGAGRRLGQAIALELARRGAHLAVHYGHSRDGAAATVEQALALGVRAVAMPADLADPAEVEALFETVRMTYGRLDLLVNSAALFEPTPLKQALDKVPRVCR